MSTNIITTYRNKYDGNTRRIFWGIKTISCSIERCHYYKLKNVGYPEINLGILDLI
jgi:hypothetical protein